MLPQSTLREPSSGQLKRLSVDVSENTVALQTQILVGEMALQRGQGRRAAKAYVAALAHTNDPQVAKRATQIALYADAFDPAWQAARVWARQAADSAPAQRTAARLALRAGDGERLRRYAAKVVQLDEDGPDAGLRALADVLSGEPDHADLALATMHTLVAKHPDSAPARYAQALLALRYQKYARAQQAAAKALALHPGWPDAILLRAGILVRKGDLAAARRWIDGLKGSVAQRADYQFAFARMLLDVGGEAAAAAAADAFDRALALRPDYADARYGLGVLALALEQWQRARAAFTALYKNGERPSDAAWYLGLVAEAQKDYAGARGWYQKVETGGHVLQAGIRAARMRYRRGDMAGARAELQAMRSSRPEPGSRLYLAEGALLFDAHKYQAALALYNQAIEADHRHPELLYARSLVYEKLGDIENAEADLRAILAADPDNARALNALGYMLSNHSARYQEALEYIQRALAEEPQDPAVMDSMGWIQYRLGNLTKARTYLQRAYKEFPDPEVAAHLGEVLWQLGQKHKARDVWRQALAEHPDHRVLRETIQRLTP